MLKSLTTGGSKDVVIIYPTGGPGETFPVLVYGHGSGAPYVSADKGIVAQFKTMASYGFIVLAFESCPLGCTAEGPDFLATLEAAGNPQLHPAFATADLSRTGIFGYSLGAGVAYRISHEPDKLISHNVRAVVAQHAGCAPDKGVWFECGSPQVPIMFTSGEKDKNSNAKWEYVYNGYKSATDVPSVFISLAGAAHVPIDHDDTVPISQFFACFVRGEQHNCDKIFGPSGKAVCQQPFDLRNPDGSFGCFVNQTSTGEVSV